MRIFVGNVPFATTEEDLTLLFEPYGIVDRVQSRRSGRPGAHAALRLWTCQTRPKPTRPSRRSTGHHWRDGS